MSGEGQRGRDFAEAVSPLVAGAGALAAIVAQAYWVGMYIPSSLYPRYDYVTALLLWVVYQALVTGFAAAVACTCFHPGQLPFGARPRAFLGAFLGGLTVPLYIGFGLSPLFAALVVYHYHQSHQYHRPRPVGAPHPGARKRGALYLLGYIVSLLVLGWLVFSQALETSGRGGYYIVLFILPIIAVLYLAGAVFLGRALGPDPSLWRRDAVVGLALHGYPLLFALGYTVSVSISNLARGDLTLTDPYSGTSRVDFTLLADPIFAAACLVFLVAYVKASLPRSPR